MNLFRKAIEAGEIAGEEDLKRAFWKLAKKLHPDAAGVASGHERFIRLKQDYDEAAAMLSAGPAVTAKPTLPSGKPKQGPPNRAVCVDLFIDLLAGNFPVDRSIRDNKVYLSRIEALNAELGKFGPEFEGLFKRFENELYALRGDSVVLNHEFSVVKLYLYRFSSFTYTKNTESYLKNGYELVRGILKKKNLNESIRFLSWLMEGIVDADKLRG